jgi:glycosyltransferase involved in cell wall biosynthesis
MNIPIYETVYNGVDIENFEFNESGGNNLLFIGRIIKKKGVEEAIKTSLLTNYPLNIVGSIREYDKDNIASFLSKINNKNIKIIKTAFRTEAIKYYSTSKITLAPILWEEPFGLITVESMAAGTPVVGYARGALPEIIKDGETGFIVNPSDDDIRGNFIIKKTGVEGLCEAVERIYSMPEDQYRKMRKACREHVEKNFTVERMVDDYEKVYEEILNKKTS